MLFAGKQAVTNETSLPLHSTPRFGVNTNSSCSCVRGAYRQRNARKGLCEAFGHLVEDGLVFDVVLVISLELGGNAVQGALESIFGGGVHHFRLQGMVRGELAWSIETAYLDTGIIWGPGNESNLASVRC